MLSVLIPTYNWNALQLVYKLQKQLEKENCIYEIIVLDDASKSELTIYNQEINKIPNCFFEELPVNMGRSKIRNMLAQRANYDWLLFLDADVDPVSEKFISIYLSEINKKKKVIVGGIAYSKCEGNGNLRWKQGKQSEEKRIEERIKLPYKYFFTGNFLIEKETFYQIYFDETIREYGYEDLVFSKQLEKHNIQVWQILNEVYHLGIDENAAFISKTKEALQNLILLIKEKKLTVKDVKIMQVYRKIQFLRLPFILHFFAESFEKRAEKKSSLFYYQLFRLAYLHKVIKNML